MIHITTTIASPEGASCGAELLPGDDLTTTALAADCDACRTKAGVALTNDKTWSGKTIGVSPVPKWEAAPMAGADDLIASALKNRG